MRPLFEHDCDCCTHLGTVKVYDGVYDLYSCPQGGHGVTLLARWSSNGPDYLSSPPQYIGDLHNPALRMALLAYQNRA